MPSAIAGTSEARMPGSSPNPLTNNLDQTHLLASIASEPDMPFTFLDAPPNQEGDGIDGEFEHEDDGFPSFLTSSMSDSNIAANATYQPNKPDKLGNPSPADPAISMDACVNMEMDTANDTLTNTSQASVDHGSNAQSNIQAATKSALEERRPASPPEKLRTGKKRTHELIEPTGGSDDSSESLSGSDSFRECESSDDADDHLDAYGASTTAFNPDCLLLPPH
ncbi:hypothetical protein MPH_02679 [Macrophomina phaseolina MS6]|uniref:Uncharacterized protein n=1 Tax=Macrophomina phaseolina (strain MS6) TaxID=1126212 RepID=K2RZB5_MACPH|nr:hypothetical protein MPH_02679 [Macrophomina phaseolina MS6]